MSAKKATVLVNAKSKDALNSHQVLQQKLLSGEARRISSIFENCISQVEIVASLPAILQIYSNAVDKELSEALQEHQILVERLEMLQDLKQESGGEQEEEDVVARKSVRLQLEKDIKNSVRDILRVFRDHPDAISGLRAVLAMELGESDCKLIRGLKLFHSHMVEKLLTSPEKELQSSLYKQVSSPTAITAKLESVVSMKEQVEADTKEKDSLISQKQIEIKHLECSLQKINTQEMDRSLPTDKQCQPHIKPTKKQASLQQEIDQLETQLYHLMLENRQAEQVLQEKNKILEKETEHLVQHFDDIMFKKQADLELNEIENEREEEELRTLEVSFSVLKVEYDQIQERRRLAEEKRNEEMRTLELKTKAAIVAQAWWRGYSVRKALKNKGKSKKAKKGKGKKK